MVGALFGPVKQIINENIQNGTKKRLRSLRILKRQTLEFVLNYYRTMWAAVQEGLPPHGAMRKNREEEKDKKKGTTQNEQDLP